MTATTGLSLDALALLLSGLSLLVVTVVHTLLWRSFRGRTMRRWAFALVALVAADMLQVAMSLTASMELGRLLGVMTQLSAFTFLGLTLSLLEHARGTSRESIAWQNRAILLLAVVTIIATVLTEPATGIAPGAWYRAAWNPSVRVIFAVLLAALALAAWRAVVQRPGETGIRLVAVGFTVAVSRPFLFALIAGSAIGIEIARGVVLVVFSIVFDAVLIGVGSVMMVLEEERANAVARATREQRAERMERLGMMAGSLAHDINNLLTAVMAGVDLARDPAATPAAVRQELEGLQGAIDHGRAMTRGLLSFAKTGRRESPLVRMGSWVQELCEHFRFTLGSAHALDVTVDGEADLPVRCDATRLQQLVVNTLINSRDATPAGSVCRVDISVRASRLEYERLHGVFLLGPGRWMVLRIADRGPGFPVDALDKVFEPFFSTKGERGTGLGLATVFAVARDAGGAVHAFNGPGGGAVIECWFPVVEGAASSA